MQARAQQGRRQRRRAIRQEGAAAVEFALILPLFIVLLLGLIDFGHLFYVVNTMTNAAREGARRGAVKATPAFAGAAAEEAANEYLSFAALAPGYGAVSKNCNLNCPTIKITEPVEGDPDATVTVELIVAGQFKNVTGFTYAVIPGFSNPFSLIQDLTIKSEMRWELAD
jgi:Flp pilus assembly protein TadG